MRNKNYLVVSTIIGVLFIIVPLISALVTATGAFGSDPGERVNRMDFFCIAAGFVIVFISIYRIRMIAKG